MCLRILFLPVYPILIWLALWHDKVGIVGVILYSLHDPSNNPLLGDLTDCPVRKGLLELFHYLLDILVRV